MIDSILNFLANGTLNWAWWQILIFTLVVTHITIASVTIFLHRCQAHRALDVHPIAGHFFRFWLWLTTGMVTKEWTAIHRKHHAKCETEDDPHSPQTRGIRKVLLEGAELYRAESKNKETIQKFGHGTPDDWIEHNLYSKFTWQGVGLMLILDVLMFGAIGLTVWAVQMLWIPIHAAGIINGLGHFWGYRNFDCEDASTNVSPWGIIIGGEELHNNHHTYATSAKFSVKWYEFDIGWGYIRALEIVGLAKVKKVAPKARFGDVKPVDQNTLEVIIANRYDVMARYAKTVKAAYRQELAKLKESRDVEYRALKPARKWFHRDEAKLGAPQREQLSQIVSDYSALHTFVEMRRELGALWGRSNASREQLLSQLQEWCKRAEESGIHALQEFAVRLRRYA
ncbi:acyl-CoA desaturase [uncultured Ralstonia sp.]|uniref:DesA family fatty acid desaturase n=1 Tax=Ralstonia sp. TaxID=54061 RepID=UPI001EA68E0C|nr:acyl-CoA desaturase [uncultured Ralstonia sp.]UCF23117.1 MAG: acyl-CoA desaturase [Ralstonia sp.]